MLFSLFSNPVSFVFYLIALFVAISVHESAHAWAADRLGDPTPRLDGRISLNPLRHLDISGLLFMLFFGFGWGKPVMFDPYNLKHPRQDAAKIALAGPLSNFILALILSILYRAFNFVSIPLVSTIGYYILPPFILLNLTLGIFNLIPIAPLDGYNLVAGLLSDAQADDWAGLRRYGIFFLLALIFPFGNTSGLDMIMSPILRFIIPLFIPGLSGAGII